MKRNKEQRARQRVFNTFHLNKKEQKISDHLIQMRSLCGSNEDSVYSWFHVVNYKMIHKVSKCNVKKENFIEDEFWKKILKKYISGYFWLETMESIEKIYICYSSHTRPKIDIYPSRSQRMNGQNYLLQSTSGMPYLESGRNMGFDFKYYRSNAYEIHRSNP